MHRGPGGGRMWQKWHGVAWGCMEVVWGWQVGCGGPEVHCWGAGMHMGHTLHKGHEGRVAFVMATYSTAFQHH